MSLPWACCAPSSNSRRSNSRRSNSRQRRRLAVRALQGVVPIWLCAPLAPLGCHRCEGKSVTLRAPVGDIPLHMLGGTVSCAVTPTSCRGAAGIAEPLCIPRRIRCMA